MTLIEARNPKATTTVEMPAKVRTRGRPKSVEVGNRVHLYLPDSLVTRLHEIQRETHAASLTEVVKSALQLYAAALAEHKKGGAVYFKRQDDNVERQLALFI